MRKVENFDVSSLAAGLASFKLVLDELELFEDGLKTGAQNDLAAALILISSFKDAWS
jgi:hypothetical protein